MNKALFIISLQHQLAMAIGNKLELKAMLKVFLKVCFNRLNLTSAHIYLYNDADGQPCKILPDVYHSTQHLISIPKYKRSKPWQTNQILKQFVGQLNTCQATTSFQCENKQYLFGFIIPEHGLLIAETHYPIEEEVQQALDPILQKLATSCHSALIHDSLVKEMQSKQLIEEKIAYQAQHDALTGLYNRHHLNTLIANTIKEAYQANYVGSIIFIDLNRFKPINDAMGHSVGDKILLTFANRLNTLRTNHIDIARFGGDEFILLVKYLNTNHELTVQTLIKQVNQLMDKPFIVNNNAFNISCSIGYVFFPLQSSTANNLIKFADIAMYEAKRSKTNQGIGYQPVMSEKIKRRLAYADDIKQGLAHDDFKLFYQPQYNHTGDIIGAEALLRWQHPIHGTESPSVYIPIAEESDLILAIGQWVLEKACHDIKKIEQLKLPNSFRKISINISARQLIQHDFHEKVKQAIAQTGIRADRLALELTESLLVENLETSIKLITALKKDAIDCSIDDFGTGYSSLTYLKRIPARILKIDRSFVTDIDQSKETAAITSMIINLGKTFNMEVIAEGVETAAELNCLKNLGCEHFQGYYFNEPMPFDSFFSLLLNE
jgi:diguanylate cyclase (GGDEF)-like protein